MPFIIDSHFVYLKTKLNIYIVAIELIFATSGIITRKISVAMQSSIRTTKYQFTCKLYLRLHGIDFCFCCQGDEERYVIGITYLRIYY